LPGLPASVPAELPRAEPIALAIAPAAQAAKELPAQKTKPEKAVAEAALPQPPPRPSPPRRAEAAVQPRVQSGYAAYQAGDLALARAEYEQALRDDAGNRDALLGIAAIEARSGRIGQAESHYRRLLKLGGDELGARLFLAQRALERGQNTAEAVEHLEAAKRCFPRYLGKDSPYLQLAKLYRGENKKEQAVAEMEAFAAIAAEDVGVRAELLAWYKEKKDAASVARVCEELVDVSPFGADRGKPPNLTLHRDYAEALITLGRKDEALRERRVQVEIVRLLPEEQRVEAGEPDDRLALGRLLLESKLPAEALEQAAAILRLVPGHVGARVLQQEASDAVGR